jgi:HJR/Mrr/RecB family endonuclease
VPDLLDRVLPEKPVLRVLLQAKKKSGIDRDDKKGVQQLVAMRKVEATPNEHSILVSTVDQFTPECQQLAEKEKVILINGYELANLLFKYL